MSAILSPVRLCQNPIRTRLFSGYFGSHMNRILPSLTRFVSGSGPSLTRIAAYSTSSEKEAALAAASTPSDSPTIFDKILSKEIPANVVYEDEKVLAFRDINPQAPVHILIIPKVKDGLSRLAKAEERHFDILGRLLYTAKVIAKQEGLEDGYRIVINDGPKGCQSVYHIHVHLLGGRQMEWPAG
ncbi:14 kDa zinc-binding protein [Beta vulgaris subsp. vulgaris]|uniref:14 kDa zinc-binding protein n=1 Tax=Beta vulgaris subsp. vulgaris TaxID=3555 RepID=UPI002036FE57|nr:14 kDa zinc-binding protein [Beta vulgaris subsp. vulgaris]